MLSVSFESEIRNGAVEVPEELRKRFVGTVRVTLSQEESASEGNYLQHLLKHPLNIPGFTPLTRDEANERDSNASD